MFIQTTIVGRISRAIQQGTPTQNGSIPINISVAVDKLNSQTGQLFSIYTAVTYWKSANGVLPFDINAMQPGAMIVAVGESSVETYQKQDGTTGYGQKIRANTLSLLSPPAPAAAPAYQPQAQPNYGAPAGYPAAPAPTPNYGQPQHTPMAGGYAPTPAPQLNYAAPQPQPQRQAPQPQQAGVPPVPGFNEPPF